MLRSRYVICAAALAFIIGSGMSASAADRLRISRGETVLSISPDVSLREGVWADVTGQEAVVTLAAPPDGDVLKLLVDPGSDFTVTIGDSGDVVYEGSIVHAGGLTIGGPTGRRAVETLVLRIVARDGEPHVVVIGVDDEGVEGLTIRAPDVRVNPGSGTLVIRSDDVRLSPRWATALGRRSLARETIGTLLLRAALVPLDGKRALPTPVAAPDEVGTVGGVIGPDIIIAELMSIANYGSENGISAFAVGTTSCNQGDQQALWVASTNQHPVIPQSMYRLKNDRFEQIGMSWVKHGFWALAGNLCQLGCQDPRRGDRLGVGCSDPYSASLNGQLASLGPRWQVNGYTGYFPYPPTRPPLTGSVIERRLQVHNVDLDPALNKGALYFVDSHYVTADDAQAGNGTNNMSYRPAVVTGPNGSGPLYRAAVTGSTQRMQPAIRAWQDTDSQVTETDVQIPGEGLFILAAKAIDRGGGLWEYEYALQNINSDRSCGSFSVPLRIGADVVATGFHDVDYHSGEPYDGTDWPATIADGSVTWSTESYDVNPNANALRWGTLYNFRFQVNIGPADTTVTLGLFKPGPQTEVTAPTIGPAVGLTDCNRNGIQDDCDIDCDALGCTPPCGISADCNMNHVPDECEPDCNGNGVADDCDIAGGGSSDCNNNTVPDDCEPDCDGDGIPDDCDTIEDCDADGIEDCLDLCPCTSAAGACICPPLGCCRYPTGFDVCGVAPDACTAQGGTPDCQGSPCIAGCMPGEVDGDFDRDGDRDLLDCGSLLTCYSGSVEQPGFVMPSTECRARFDFDGDTDVDLTDYKTFRTSYSGPVP